MAEKRYTALMQRMYGILNVVQRIERAQAGHPPIKKIEYDMTPVPVISIDEFIASAQTPSKPAPVTTPEPSLATSPPPAAAAPKPRQQPTPIPEGPRPPLINRSPAPEKITPATLVAMYARIKKMNSGPRYEDMKKHDIGEKIVDEICKDKGTNRPATIIPFIQNMTDEKLNFYLDYFSYAR